MDYSYMRCIHCNPLHINIACKKKVIKKHGRQIIDALNKTPLFPFINLYIQSVKLHYQPIDKYFLTPNMVLLFFLALFFAATASSGDWLINLVCCCWSMVNDDDDANFFLCVGEIRHGVFAEAMFQRAQFRKHWTTPAEQDQIACQFIRKEVALIRTLWYLTVLMQSTATSRKTQKRQMLAISQKQPLLPLPTQATDLAPTHPLRLLRRREMGLQALHRQQQLQWAVLTIQQSRVVTSPVRL